MQLGLGSTAVLLRGLSPGQIAVLEHLDGTRSHGALRALAAQHGDEPQRVDDLLAVLSHTGAMADPGSERIQRLNLPAAPRPIIVGGPPTLTESVSRALRQADVPDIRMGATALDHAELALRDRFGSAVGPTPRPGLVVLTAYDGIDPDDATPWLRHGVPHLAFTTDGDRIIVGPLVVPGQGGGSTCLRCVELHRCDRDSARPTVLAQTTRRAAPHEVVPLSGTTPRGGIALTAIVGPGGHVDPTRLEAAALATAASVAALVVAAYLGGVTLPSGVTVELTVPWPRLDHRRWTRHPRCPHHLDPSDRVQQRGTMGQ